MQILLYMPFALGFEQSIMLRIKTSGVKSNWLALQFYLQPLLATPMQCLKAVYSLV